MLNNALNPPDPWESGKRARLLPQVMRAAQEGRRLASFRRAFCVALVITSVPIAVLGRAGYPRMKQILADLSVVWLAMFLPMLRLLYLEWRNRRMVRALRALLGAPVRRSNSRASDA